MKIAFQQAKLLKAVLGGSVLLSLIVGFLCISFIHATLAHADMGSVHAAHAISPSLNTCCDIGVKDHMELWKSTLVGILPQSFQDLLVLIALVVVTACAFAGFFEIPRLDTSVLFYRYRQYAREHPDILAYNHLRLAFARGILHPKTF